ncbi:MAG: hypothetical protein WAV05_02685 [Anaerolineales bacterium]
MDRKKLIYLLILVLVASNLACSLTSTRQQVQTAAQTVSSVKTEVGGLVNAGSSLIKTAQGLATEHPGILETVQAIATQGAPVISTIQAVATNNPSLVQTAQAIIAQEIPTGEPPGDIPVLNPDQVYNYFGSSQYIFYTTPTQYPQVFAFYQSEMPDHGWQVDQVKSHEYANAAELVYTKDTRTATINLSLNPLNNTSVIAISISNH